MKVAGIIAEYNPFHNGHFYHLEQTRKITGCDYCIAVMGGSFLQRGEAAIRDKFFRTQAALHGGADLVLELPTVFSTASAELFSSGGVRTLAATGVCTHLSFGSEIADFDVLMQASSYFEKENADFVSALRSQLHAGKSFPRARYDAASSLSLSPALLQVLSSPNSILAMEYLKAIRQFAPDMQPVPIERQGYYHSTALNDPYPSGTAVRNAILDGRLSQALSHMPGFAGEDPSGWDDLQQVSENTAQLALYALRSLSPEELRQLPDVREGFENVLYRAARSSRTMTEFFAAVKSKRYTLARCRRIACHALLHITKSLQAQARKPEALYLRVLGFRNTARPLLSAISRSGTAPVVLRYGDRNNLSPTAQALLDLDLFAHDIYWQSCQQPQVVRDFSRPVLTL